MFKTKVLSRYIVMATQEYDKGTILYHGGKDFDIRKANSFYTKDYKYAKKYASQHGGDVHSVMLNRKPKIYTYKDNQPVPWQEVKDIQNSILLKNFDAALVLESDLSTSLLVLNPDILTNSVTGSSISLSVLRRLKKALSTDEAYAIMDKAIDGADTWVTGGCLLLANALKILIPDGQVVIAFGMNKDSKKEKPEHAVFVYQDHIIDGDGVSTLERFKTLWEHSEGISITRLENLNYQKHHADYIDNAKTKKHKTGEKELAKYLARYFNVHSITGSSVVRLYRGLRQKFDSNYDLTKTDAPHGYSTWTDSLELAKQYAGDSGYVYYIDLPKSEMGTDVMNKDGDRVLFYLNDKPAGLHGVKGKEFLVYTEHDSYNHNLIKEYK